MLCRNLDGESLPNVFRLPAMEQRNLFTKTQADSVTITEECEQETHKVSIGGEAEGERERERERKEELRGKSKRLS